jgi:uncharacterized protein
MVQFQHRLAALGPVTAFDYPYQRAGSRRPDPLPKLVEAHRDALRALRDTGAEDIVLIGKSMGSRVGCHLALLEPVSAIVCLGYPLCGAGKRTNLRDEVLKQQHTPVLFVQGTRDTLCPLDLLQAVRREMTAPNELFIVESGDHSLQATRGFLKQHGLEQSDVETQVVDQIGAFLGRVPR